VVSGQVVSGQWSVAKWSVARNNGPYWEEINQIVALATDHWSLATGH